MNLEIDRTRVLTRADHARLRGQSRTCDRMYCRQIPVTCREYKSPLMAGLAFYYHCAEHSGVKGQVQNV